MISDIIPLRIINISSEFTKPDEYLNYHYDTADRSLYINEKAIKTKS